MYSLTHSLPTRQQDVAELNSHQNENYNSKKKRNAKQGILCCKTPQQLPHMGMHEMFGKSVKKAEDNDQC